MFAKRDKIELVISTKYTFDIVTYRKVGLFFFCFFKVGIFNPDMKGISGIVTKLKLLLIPLS